MSGASHTRRARDAANTEAVEDYAKAIYALARRAERAGRRPRRSPSGSASRRRP